MNCFEIAMRQKKDIPCGYILFVCCADLSLLVSYGPGAGYNEEAYANEGGQDADEQWPFRCFGNG